MLLDALLAQFDIQGLVLDLLRQVVILAVVAHIVLLLLVAVDSDIGVLRLDAHLRQLGLTFLDVVLDIGDLVLVDVVSNHVALRVVYLNPIGVARMETLAGEVGRVDDEW